ncbi:hypothetical protein, partial [Escherichia coli]|uniref:hypothetical protein n=1 Tax=Escherichia coli TaxID=562 RepID=UPI0039DFF21D
DGFDVQRAADALLRQRRRRIASTRLGTEVPHARTVARAVCGLVLIVQHNEARALGLAGDGVVDAGPGAWRC